MAHFDKIQNRKRKFAKFSMRYLCDPEYVRIINEAIREEYIKYAFPVYGLTCVSVDSFLDIVLTINSENILRCY